MHNTRQLNIAEIKEILRATSALDFKALKREETYQWIEDTLRGAGYLKLTKPDKGVVRCYLQKMTGYSDAQIDRLICQFKIHNQVKLKQYRRRCFTHIYTFDDVALLAETDLAFRRLAGPATAAVFKREYELFGKKEYVRLAHISSSHIYNLRQAPLYRTKTRLFSKTQARQVSIGQRKKPEPNGQPGFIRVDTVHQGDSVQGVKGLYSVNLVSELTQFEIVAAVEKISEMFMVPVLELALNQFPFNIINFHTDNGSEYINYQVVDLLNRLVIKLTKSRARQTNDNALVESKNGAIIRKYLGYSHIPQGKAYLVNQWYQNYLNTLVNYHRPCAFGKEVMVKAKTGKYRRVYPHDDYQVPYEKLKSLKKARQYLKPGITFAELDKIAYAESDIEFAQKVEQARSELFKKINS